MSRSDLACAICANDYWLTDENAPLTEEEKRKLKEIEEFQEKERREKAIIERNKRNHEFLKENWLHRMMTDNGLERLVNSLIDKKLDYLLEKEPERIEKALEKAKQRRETEKAGVNWLVAEYSRLMKSKNPVTTEGAHSREKAKWILWQAPVQSETRELGELRKGIYTRGTHLLYTADAAGRLYRELPRGWHIPWVSDLEKMGRDGRKELYEAIRRERSFQDEWDCYDGTKCERTGAGRNYVHFWSSEGGDLVGYCIDKDGYGDTFCDGRNILYIPFILTSM